ncbi:putative uroporphyrin-III C/tetrapyrrole methyltransferase [Candidatus Termititenax aidoneus]|uniref:Ribosomal RNA small subunit methyltransferase I n=1 Tax=Termititenax aidoneus TaxID=2218524 RepID=A0A388T9W7_TERA1|nr:putative uroporphyrin-III C/tetrapyrrole methyltransferase [Candidatus Termititenax aidoneus]
MALVVCGLPIGNPDDISPRVLQNLREADLIAAEDTRTAARLLQKHGIVKKIISFYDHNELSRTPQILASLQAGQTVALISEAGMPLISDPGYHLVAAAQEAGLSVEVIPGPTALITALTASGLPTNRFAFEGFLPAKPSARQNVLRELQKESRTLIFYEAPHRIGETLQDIAKIFPERQCFVARELTKKYQEYWRGRAAEILAKLKTPQGEFVLVLAGCSPADNAEISPEAKNLLAALQKAGLPDSQCANIAAETFQLSRNRLKKIIYSL